MDFLLGLKFEAEVDMLDRLVNNTSTQDIDFYK